MKKYMAYNYLDTPLMKEMLEEVLKPKKSDKVRRVK